MPLSPNACDNCGGPVLVRRPSKSGKHFCKASKCQTAKQRFYREAGQTDSVDLARQLVHDVANLARKTCPGCGLENAVPGWAHRDAPGSSRPCYASGGLGPGLPSGYLDAVHPELVPNG